MIGAVVGLVVGAGGLGLAWGLSGGGDDGDVVCDLIADTQPLTKEFELGEARRVSGLGELAASLAEEDKAYQPLADTMEKVVIAIQSFALPEQKKFLQEAQSICDDL